MHSNSINLSSIIRISNNFSSSNYISCSINNISWSFSIISSISNKKSVLFMIVSSLFMEAVLVMGAVLVGASLHELHDVEWCKGNQTAWLRLGGTGSIKDKSVFDFNYKGKS